MAARVCALANIRWQQTTRLLCYATCLDVMQKAIHLCVCRRSRLPIVSSAILMPDDSLSHLASVRWLEDKQLHKRAVLKADSLLTLAQAARNGMGLAILPCYLADPDPMLARVSAPIDELASDLWLLTHPKLTRVPRIRTFMDAMYDQIMGVRPLFEGRESETTAAIKRSSQARPGGGASLT